MSKKRAPVSVTPSAVYSWVKLHHPRLVAGFTSLCGLPTRFTYAPTQDGVTMRLRWGDVALTGQISSRTRWNMEWVPDTPDAMKPHTFKEALTHDENHLFDSRTWGLTIAWETFTNANPRHVGANLWRGLGSDVTDAWPAVERFCTHLARIRTTREGVFSRLSHSGWQREGDILHKPGLCAPSLRIDASGGAYVVEQRRALPADDLAAFLERYPQD